MKKILKKNMKIVYGLILSATVLSLIYGVFILNSNTELKENTDRLKVAATTLTKTTSNLANSLNSIKTSLDNNYIYSSNLFNCQGSKLTCTSSGFANVGVLSLDEYKNLEGDDSNSYLYNSNAYYLLNGTQLVTSKNQTSTATNAYVRPVMYLDNETTVTGSGTSTDPYIIEKEDYNLVVIMVEQSLGKGDYIEQSEIPTGDYQLNDSSSYCIVNGVIDNDIELPYNSEDGLIMSDEYSKGTKCYLYFDIEENYTQLVHYQFLYDGSLGNNSSNQMTSVTGGWKDVVGYDYWGNKTSVSYGSNSINVTVAQVSVGTRDRYVMINKTLDYTQYSYLFAKISGHAYSSNNSYGYETQIYYGLDVDKTSLISGGGYGVSSKDVNGIVNVKITSNSNTNVKFGAFANSNSNATYINLYEVWLTKEDDYATLASKAGVSASSIDDLLNNNSSTILNNKNSVKYMIYNCTGDFMAKAITNSTFISAYKNSPYKSVIDANDHWAKFLSFVS